MDEKMADGAVRVMSQKEKAEYEDITIEECGAFSGEGEGSSGDGRPRTFNEVYEESGERRQAGNARFAGYGGNGAGIRFYRINLGRSVTPWQKWKYRIIGALVAAAVIWFLIFVALPVAAVGVVAAMIAYMLYSFFS